MAEASRMLTTTYYAVGGWKLDLYVGTTLDERVIIIDTHVDAEIDGFFGAV